MQFLRLAAYCGHRWPHTMPTCEDRLPNGSEFGYRILALHIVSFVFIASASNRTEEQTEKVCHKIKVHNLQSRKSNLNANFAFLLFSRLFAGAIFEQGTDEVQSAFKFAMLNHNLNVTARRFELQAYVDVINTADAFKLSRLSK